MLLSQHYLPTLCTFDKVWVLGLNVCTVLGINLVEACIISSAVADFGHLSGLIRVTFVSLCDRWIKVSSCTSESKLHPGNWKWLVWKGEVLSLNIAQIEAYSQLTRSLYLL